MSYINTNITSLIAQANLNKSQNMLSTAMERLSSGMRINSAKDDAAGQAIANRMTAQTTGLQQAQRNANDGISIAQTAEGALNQINDNLQRIRELAVQAANETNSNDDLQSIQDEINQRQEEIDRISRETDFNGVKVLAEDRSSFRVQVGANDGEIITIGLQEITTATLGVEKFSVKDMLYSSNISLALTEVQLDESDASVTLSIGANAFSIGTTPVASNVVPLNADGEVGGAAAVYAVGTDVFDSGYAVLASDGNYYELAENTVTGVWSFDSGTAPATVGDFASVERIDVLTTSLGTAAANFTDAAGFSLAALAGYSATLVGGPNAGDTVDNFFGTLAANVIANIYERTDVENGYAIEGADGNFYAINVTDSGGLIGLSLVGGTGAGDEVNWIQISAENIGSAASEIVIGTEALPATGNILNQDVNGSGTDAPTGVAIFEIDGGATNTYAVEASDGRYYLGTLNTSTGAVEWDSAGTGSFVDAADIIGIDGAGVANTDVTVTTRDTASIATQATGLADGETLHTGADGGYIIKGLDGSGNTTYHEALVHENGDGTVTIAKATDDNGDVKDALTVDPLATLDSALRKVDALRSDLGAIQNRFSDAITNLNTNETNLLDARSRIQDTDYAREVAQMTRAQILQQAGTSVLAQANQLPQNVLSLLG